MEKQKKLVFFLYLFFFFFALLTGLQLVEGSSHHHSVCLSKLFVFGDSYAATGNNKKAATSWKVPYGVTFPGKPVGRSSDGRLLTDYLASFVGIKSPIPYRWRKMGTKQLRYGMNFAYGGTGVFYTFTPEPNMTTQIDFFQHLIHDGVYTKLDLDSSLALVSLAGNDYGAYQARNGTDQDLPAFIVSVVNQLALNLKRIHGLGVRKVVVTGLEPVGCLPQHTSMYSYQHCNETLNTVMSLHNLLLQETVKKLNNGSNDSTFIILDLHNAFMSAFNSQGDHPGSLKFESPLKPCCVGISEKYSCGSVDESGVKKYTVCQNPQSAFFWDALHPSQQGWHSVYSTLQASLEGLYSSIQA